MKTATLIATALGLSAFGLFASPAQGQQKRIYIACDDHTDYMWTADEETYKQAFLEMIDWYLDLADLTGVLPPDLQSRFACDGSFWLWTYEKNRTPQQFQRLIDRIKDGHISAPMTSLVSCYGAQPAEAVIRGMLHAGRMERKYGFRFRMAVAMENQTLPWGLASLFAGSGAWYSWKGICGCASKIPDAWNREHDIYDWMGPDGKKLLTKWNSNLVNGAQGMGGYAEARNPLSVVPYVTSSSAFQSRYPFPVIGCFGKGADDLKTKTFEFPLAAYDMTNAQRRVIVSNEQDFFDDFKANYGAGLPAVAYSYGNEWDLYCASMAEVTGSVKRSVESLRGAEAMGTLASLYIPGVTNSLAAAREQAFLNLGLFWEHDWTADGPVSKAARAAWQRKMAKGVTDYAAALETISGVMLGRLIKSQPGTLRFYVFNPLSWQRTDYADLPVPLAAPVRIVDVSTGQDVPSQFTTVDNVLYLRIHAKDIPSVGYKVFEITPNPGQSVYYGNAATFSGGTLENTQMRVKIEPRGAITSLVDHNQNDREFATSVNGLAINDLGPSSGTLVLEDAGPVSLTVRAEAPFPVQHKTWVTVYRDGRRVDIRNQITQNFGTTLTNGFSFLLNSPLVRHEELGAIATARLVSQGGHYATQSARYDWLTLNHFVDMIGSDAATVSLSSADNSFFRLGNSSTDFLDTSTPQIRVLVGGQVDGPTLGIQNQGGDTEFLQRFALSTFPYPDTVASMRAALEHQNPLRCGVVTGYIPELPADTYSLVSLSNPRVVLWAFKPAEEGIQSGLMIARFWNLDDSPQTVTIQLAKPFDLRGALTTSHLETNEVHLGVSSAGLAATFAPQELKTFRLVPAKLPPP